MINRFIATNAVVRAVDHMPAAPVSITVSNAFVSVQNLGPDMGRSLPVALGFELLSGGRGTVAGNITPAPLAAELRVDVKALFFRIGQPYVQDILRLKLKNGTVSVNGDAKLSLNDTNAFEASYLGDIQVNNVEVNEETDLPFASVGEVKIDDLEIDWPMDDFKVKSVFVNEPAAHLYLREDGAANVEEMVPASITEQI